jgi:hypothetical protein
MVYPEGTRANITRDGRGTTSRPPNCSMKPTPLAALAASASPRPLRRVEASGFSAPWGGGLSRALLGRPTGGVLARDDSRGGVFCGESELFGWRRGVAAKVELLTGGAGGKSGRRGTRLPS